MLTKRNRFDRKVDMKRKKTIKKSVNKLDSAYKYVNKGEDFLENSVCQLQENVGDGTGWFLGLRKGGRNKVRCKFEDFQIYDRDGNTIELQNEF